MKDHYIIFTIADTAYALPTHQVAHVEMIEEVTRVPNAPQFVDGVVFSRGEVVPAMSVRARFGFERQAYDTRTRLLVTQSGARKVGLIVDSAREFLTIPDAAIKPPNEALTALSGEYLRGIATLGDRIIVVLELDAVLNPHDVRVSTTGSVAPHYSQEIR